MSETGRQARGKSLEVTCVSCRRKFPLPAETFLDGGAVNCPRCGTEYRSDGSAGKGIDRMVKDFGRSLRKHSRRLGR